MRARTALLLLALATAPPVAAQIRVDADTQVRSIRFSGVREVPEPNLREVIKTRDRGSSYGLRVALGKLPFVSPPAPRYFSPLDLQRDVVRLRERYRDAGFLEARVRYEVERDEGRNLIAIVFLVEEGPPTRVVAASIVGPDSLTPLSVPDSLSRSWRSIET